MNTSNLIDILNKGRQSNKYDQFVSILIELMKSYNKTQIYFGNIHFDIELQMSVIDDVNIAPYINALYHNVSHGSFDYIVKESNDKKNRQLIFSDKCGERAYAIYMFFIMGYRLPDNLSQEYLHPALAGKTINDISYVDARHMRCCKINMCEYTYYENDYSDDELNLLKEYLDKY